MQTDPVSGFMESMSTWWQQHRDESQKYWSFSLEEKENRDSADGPFNYFSFLYLKKTKYQKYMPNREIFKNGCMSPQR